MAKDAQSFKQFSLRSRVVGAPRSGRSRQAMIEMCPANGAAGRTVQRLAHASVLVTGRGALRRIAEWPLPISRAGWDGAERCIRDCAGVVGGEVIWHLPPPDQAQIKFGALFLDEDGQSRIFARVLLEGEASPLTPSIGRGNRTGIGWPMRLAVLSHQGLSIEVTTTTPPGLHVPVSLDLPSTRSLADDVAEALASECPEGVPSHWRPMHGDMASWNLRRYSNGETLLLDWEESGWAPPHADLVRFLMTAPHGLTLARQLEAAATSEMAEAVEFWRHRLTASASGTVPEWVNRKRMAQATKLDAIRGQLSR